ncbi:YciC family protein [Buchnera aphidicola (Taiwanaphis decaspermi)]|uniref:YciC family protein n=1 Tax=Buchnera aphidicola TaxID=9 RepID=UPI0031B804A4
MYLKIKKMFNNTKKIFHNKIYYIFLISFFSSLISLLIYYILEPSFHNLNDMYKNIKTNNIIYNYLNVPKIYNDNFFSQKTFFNVINGIISNLILFIGITRIVTQIPLKTVKKTLINMFHAMPKFIFLGFLFISFIYILFMVILTPRFLFYFLSYFLTPILLMMNMEMLSSFINYIVKNFFKKITIILPIITFVLLSKLIIMVLSFFIKFLPFFYFYIILNTILNVISSISIIYLFNIYFKYFV